MEGGMEGVKEDVEGWLEDVEKAHGRVDGVDGVEGGRVWRVWMQSAFITAISGSKFSRNGL